VNKILQVAILYLFLQGIAGCGIDGPTGSIVIVNDLSTPVRLQICDHTGCNNLNDRVDPGGRVDESINLSRPTRDPESAEPTQ
jgi:hypothetical protein